MVRATPIQTSFNQGEFSPLLNGHINLEAWSASAQTIQNLIPLKQGPLTRRGGTYYVKEVKTSADNTVLIPFEFNVEQTYQIEAGDQYFRFYNQNSVITEAAQSITGVTQANPAVVTYSGADNYANGDEVFISGVVGMTELNGKFYKVANVNTGANTFELQDIDGNDVDSTGYTAYSSGGTVAEVYEVTSPYATADLQDSNYINQFQTAQSADVLYIVHGSYNTRSLGRTSNTNWTVTNMSFNDGPYLPENATTTTLTLSGTTGSVTVTASATTGINNDTGFQSTDVGRLIRWKDPANEWTWLEITAVGSTTSVTATIKGQDASATTATNDWRLGVYSETTGYPRVITFFQDRILLAGNDSYPDRYDMTRTGGYSDGEFLFAPSDVDGTVTDDAAISGTLQSGTVNVIQWANSDERGLVIGTAGAEWIVRPDTDNGVLTPSNAKADRLSSIGSSYIEPIGIESGTVFIQRARRKMNDLIYNFNSDALKPRDLSIRSEHITESGIAEIVFQQEPINNIWSRRTDGRLIGMTYYPDENVFASHQHVIGGTDAKVRSISVTLSSDESRDELWMVVERTINGVTRKYIEYLKPYYDGTGNLEDAIHVDSALTYDGASTTSVSGLEHLEGETVKVMVDGKAHPDLTVSSGSVTLANDVSGSVIQIGLGNTWIFKSQNYEAGSRTGTSQGKTRRVSGLVINLLYTLGLKYGTASDNVEEYDFEQGQAYDTAETLYSGFTPNLTGPFGYTQSGEIYLTHDGVFPATILAIIPEMVTYDRG